MKTPSSFKKSNFYISLVCNYWVILTTVIVITITCLTILAYFIFRNTIPIYLYLLHSVLGYIYYIYYVQGMIKKFPARKKLYITLAESIESGKPFKKSMVYDMMYTRCEAHIVKCIERAYGIKLV